MTIATTVRFDAPLIVHENVMIELFLKVCDPRTMIIVKEFYSMKTKSPSKEHYHIYMDCTKNADQCIRNILKKVMPEYQHTPEHKASKSISFGIKHNPLEIAKGYLYKSWDRDDEYCSKIVYQHAHDTPNIPQYIEAYNNSFSKVKQKFNTEMYQIKVWIKEREPNLLNIEPSELCKLVQKYYFEHEKPFHKAHMGQVVNHLMYLYNPQDETFTNLLLEEIGHCSAEYENTRMMENELRSLKRQVKELLKFQPDPE